MCSNSNTLILLCTPAYVQARENRLELTSEAEISTEVEEIKEDVCDTLLMCIVTTLNQGLRNGGGIGDVLRPPSKTVSNYVVH